MKRLLLIFIFVSATATAQTYTREGSSIIVTHTDGVRLRLTPYGNQIIRIQKVRKNEDFFADDHYEMVEKHDWLGKLTVVEGKTFFWVASEAKEGFAIKVDKDGLQLSYYQNGKTMAFLKDSAGVSWENDTIRASFVGDPSEHFTGLGHGYFGREESIELRGKEIARNYGTEHGQQAPLIVPFYLSDKGYGIFLNSTFPNKFNFGKNGKYGFAIEGEGRMDYFVIFGPQFPKIIDQYTQLTGRPRFRLNRFSGWRFPIREMTTTRGSLPMSNGGKRR